MKTIGKDFGDVARKTYAVASGALGNGKAVIVNADGTVSAAASTNNSQIVTQTGLYIFICGATKPMQSWGKWLEQP